MCRKNLGIFSLSYIVFYETRLVCSHSVVMEIAIFVRFVKSPYSNTRAQSRKRNVFLHIFRFWFFVILFCAVYASSQTLIRPFFNTENHSYYNTLEAGTNAAALMTRLCRIQYTWIIFIEFYLYWPSSDHTRKIRITDRVVLSYGKSQC